MVNFGFGQKGAAANTLPSCHSTASACSDTCTAADLCQNSNHLEQERRQEGEEYCGEICSTRRSQEDANCGLHEKVRQV